MTAPNGPRCRASDARQPLISPSATEPHGSLVVVGGMPHLSSILSASRKVLPRAHAGRQDGERSLHGASDDSDFRAFGQGDVVVGRDGVGEHVKFELALAIGL